MTKISFLNLLEINQRHRPEIEQAIARVLDSGWYLQGAENENFCREFAMFCGTRHALGVANGLDALYLILKGYGFGPGDEIIVPANTYIATILAITRCGCTPVLVEPDIETFNMDPHRVAARITPKTKAVLVVHLYGRAMEMQEIWRMAKCHDLKIIEDAAQAHGAIYKGRRAGNLGDAAAFSFYPGKNLGAIGDGGAITTNDSSLHEKMRAMANYGSSVKYHHECKGVNSRLDELQAAVLSVKLVNLDEDNERRRSIAARYCQEIRNPLVILPCIPTDAASHVWHLFVVRTPERDGLRQYLADSGIFAQIHYPVPAHKQPAYAEWSMMTLPVTERIHREALSLPISPVMTEEEVDAVAAAVNSWRG